MLKSGLVILIGESMIKFQYLNLPNIVINAEVVCFSHRNSDGIKISIKILEEFRCRLSADGTMVLFSGQNSSRILIARILTENLSDLSEFAYF